MKIKLCLAFSLMLVAFSCSKEATVVNESATNSISAVAAPQVQSIEVAEDIENPIEFIRETIFESKGNPSLHRDCLCQVLDWVNHTNVTQTSATINWGEPQNCGYYYLIIHNLTDDTYDYIQGNFVNDTSYPLDFLEPCTDYKVYVGHIGDFCASKGISTTFTTDCKDVCITGGNFPDEFYIQNFYLFFDESIWSYDPTVGYVDKTDVTLSIPLNTPTNFSSAGLCATGDWESAIYTSFWIDINDNSIFDPSELMYSFTDNSSAEDLAFCLSVPMPQFTTPGTIACGVRARFIISTDPINDPCEIVNRGQVMDFMINAGGC